MGRGDTIRFKFIVLFYKHIVRVSVWECVACMRAPLCNQMQTPECGQMGTMDSGHALLDSSENINCSHNSLTSNAINLPSEVDNFCKTSIDTEKYWLWSAYNH